MVGNEGPVVVQITNVVWILTDQIAFVVKSILDEMPTLVKYSASVKIQLLERRAMGQDPFDLVIVVEYMMT
jgi:hypothetical protein